MTDLNLDRPTAMLMYRAERLQEKGQLQQALRYFDQVLAVKPDCEEAAVNARMLREELADQRQQRLPAVNEHPASPEPSTSQALQTADMEINFTCKDGERYEAYFDKAALDKVALQMARNMLEEHGIKTPFVTLVSNDINTWTPRVDIDPWMDNVHECRAIVRATFPPAASRAAGVFTSWQAPSVGGHVNLSDLGERLGSPHLHASETWGQRSERSEPAAEPAVPKASGSNGSGMPGGHTCAAAAASAAGYHDAQSQGSGSSSRVS